MDSVLDWRQHCYYCIECELDRRHVFFVDMDRPKHVLPSSSFTCSIVGCAASWAPLPSGGLPPAARIDQSRALFSAGGVSRPDRGRSLPPSCRGCCTPASWSANLRTSAEKFRTIISNTTRRRTHTTTRCVTIIINVIVLINSHVSYARARWDRRILRLAPMLQFFFLLQSKCKMFMFQCGRGGIVRFDFGCNVHCFTVKLGMTKVDWKLITVVRTCTSQ